MLDLAQIDPDWAWSPYEPGPEAPWDRRRAAHLYRRAGFGASAAALDRAVSRPPAETVSQLIHGGQETEDFRQAMASLATTLLASGDARRLAAWWHYRILGTPDQLHEKMAIFWHGHFATSDEKVQDAALMLAQNQLIRQHALGDFAALTHGMSRDPAMLIYLDSATNRKAHPNENFARELMELFCLGEGNYTERDVQELARCFTGWEIRRGRYRFNRYQHDTGTKEVLGERGDWTGEQAVDIVLREPAAPRFIVKKLLGFFLVDETEIPDRLLEPLARQLRETDLNVGPVVERILGSQLFFSDTTRGQKVRSPIELSAGLLRTLEASTDVVNLSSRLADLGHALFYPPNVKGWEGGRNWINSSTLLGRANLTRDLLENEKTRFDGETLEELFRRNGLDSPESQVAWLEEMLMARPLADAAKAPLEEVAGRDGPRALVHVFCTLPEFHLG